MGQWIACTDRLPDLDAHGQSVGVLIAVPGLGGAMEAYLWNFHGRKRWDTGDGELYELDEVSHWMPMPDPPAPED